MRLFTPKWMKRADEAAKLTDPEKLLKAALESDNYDVNISAVSRLVDQEKLFKVATETKKNGVVYQAINQLTDDNLLLRFIKERGARFELLELAIDRLSDQESLLEIAKYLYQKNSYIEYRRWAVYRALYRVYDIEILKRYKKQKHGSKTTTERYADDILRLASELPGDPEKQRDYINSLQNPGEVSCCCVLIDSLRPYAEDVNTVLEKRFLRFDNTAPGQETLRDHKYACERWKRAAERIIAASIEKPKILYPIWDLMTDSINGTEAVIRERKEIGVRYIGDRYEPTKVIDYEYYEDRTPMGLVFPG